MASDLTNTGVPDPVANQLASFYTRAQTRMREMILNPKGRTQSSRDFRMARASEQLNQVDKILAELGTVSAKWTGKNIAAAVANGRALADKQAIETGLHTEQSLKGSTALIDTRTVKILALDTVADLSKGADSMGETTKRLLRKTAEIGLTQAQINTIIAGGVIEGTPAETIRELRDELRKIHGGKTLTITDKNGDPITYDAGYYAGMVVRTKTREANVMARHQRLGELGMDLVRIVGRISDNFCTAFLGQVFSLSGKHPKYPAYSSLTNGGPPFHPNCSKSTAPFVEDLASDKQLDAAEGVPDAQQLLGMDSSKAQRAYKDLQLRQQATENYKKVTRVAGRKES